ncbi:MAG: GntR family transcriptional regulator [Geobacter sp.]|nr:GntR family transcriptional regulator [Geobacter sp.]
MFRQAKQNRIFQDVVEQIQEAIVSGKLKAGEHLPAERELKEKFNVSRGTLREALRVLEQKGLIQIKTGVTGGSVVRGASTDQMSESLGLLIRSRKVSLQQLAEFREGVEGLVAALAAERATAKDVQRLQTLLGQAKELLSKGALFWDAFIRTDEEIHLALAEMTANQLYISVLQTVYSNIHTYYESYLAKEEHLLEENYRDLADIVQAIATKNAESARHLAQDHVRRFNSYMEHKGAT